MDAKIKRIEITPLVLYDLYHGWHFVVCQNCCRVVAGVHYRDQCDCEFCKNGNDDFCVNLPRFSRNYIKCPYCSYVMNEIETEEGEF